MKANTSWSAWTAEQVVAKLPLLIATIDANLAIFAEEFHQKNRELITSLSSKPVTVGALRDGSRHSELASFAFALDVCGRRAALQGDSSAGLELLLAAHEIFRTVNHDFRPSKPMRQAVENALRVVSQTGIRRVESGETDAGSLRDEMRDLVVSAWGNLPPQLALTIDESVLNGLENLRVEHDGDREFEERIVRNNIEAVLGLEVPRRLEEVRKHWHEIGEHVAPSATRIAALTVQRPSDLGDLLSQNTWEGLRQAVERGDVGALGRILAESEDLLENNLRLRLDAKPEFRQPTSELRFKNGPDKFFVEARDLLVRRDARALQKFNNIHYNKSNNPFAKEWYAYALSQFGASTDIHEIINLLEDAISSEYFRSEISWSARWNLACALRRFHDRAHEALDILLPILDNDSHSSESFELCLLWALEQQREGVLSRLLLKAPYYEAHLLAASYEIEGAGSEGSTAVLQAHFRRINRILQNPDRLFPEPKERLSFDELDRLTREFIETSLLEAGIEWFQQRLSYGQERLLFKNWECAARLHEGMGDFGAAWRCRKQQWNATERNPRVERDKKSGALRNLLNWALRHGFEKEASQVLRLAWKSTTMTEADARLWENRLAPSTTHSSAHLPSTLQRDKQSGSGTRSESPPPGIEGPTNPADADKVIQQFAGSFSNLHRIEDLVLRVKDAEHLLQSIRLRYPDLGSETSPVIRMIGEVDAILRFGAGVGSIAPGEPAHSQLGELRTRLSALRNGRKDLPFELTGLAQALERLLQNLAARLQGIPDLSITPPNALHLAFGAPPAGVPYATRLFARLTNPGPEEMTGIVATFMCADPEVEILGGAVTVATLVPRQAVIVECPMRLSGGPVAGIDVRVLVTYEAGGFSRTTQATGKVPIKDDMVEVPARFVTGKPVATDRPDLFQGRERELAELGAAVSGSRLLKLYFVNGIRAVGKTSLMQHLGARCGSDFVAVLLNVEAALGGPGMTSTQLIRQLCRLALREVQTVLGLPIVGVSLPDARAFELDPPWVVFDAFLDELRTKAGRERILLSFDEMQAMVRRIADTADPLDEGFLSWLRDKIQTDSAVRVICSGSEPFGLMRKRYERHTVWRNIEPYDISFVDRLALERIACVPVKEDHVLWLPEALDRLWDFTEGHPWVTQMLAENAIKVLNLEYRRVVGPLDVERAADAVPLDSSVWELWWNEKEGTITSSHRQVAFLILQHQPSSRLGLGEKRLAELAQNAGIRVVGRYLDEMRALEVLTPVPEGDTLRWRVKGAFLERYLTLSLQRALQVAAAGAPQAASDRPLALLLDFENVKIRLSEVVKGLPTKKAESLLPRLDGGMLANRLLEAAARHGMPRQRWAVADWDRAFFQGDQKAFKMARYSTDIAGHGEKNSSDHVLRERIHFVLREHPEVETFVIGTGDGDFHETIKTLQEQGKKVVLWATRQSINRAYGESLRGPDHIRIEWLEDLVFSEEGQAEVTDSASSDGSGSWSNSV